MYRNTRVLCVGLGLVTGRESGQETALDKAAGDSCACYGENRRLAGRTLPSAMSEQLVVMGSAQG